MVVGKLTFKYKSTLLKCSTVKARNVGSIKGEYLEYKYSGPGRRMGKQ